MLRLENTVTPSPEQWEAIIRGMRNPMNSWDKSDSVFEYDTYSAEHDWVETHSCLDLGKADHELMMKLSSAGSDHAKFRRMIPIYVDIVAPLYWWKEFDAYKIGTVANSCSTMHKIHDKGFGREDFSVEHIHNLEEHHWMVCMDNTIAALNVARHRFLETNDKKYWWQMIQLLPSSYNQRRIIMLNYEVLANIYKSRRNHKLTEWHTFCDWIEKLPYSEIIIGDKTNGQT